jgi:hypothetical protein
MPTIKEDLKNQVSLGAEVIKTAALFFHKQNLKSQPLEENQLVPFAACFASLMVWTCAPVMGRAFVSAVGCYM